MGRRARRAALAAFAALSLTSLFADATYEGARSVSGPFLEYLGAGILAAGALSVGDLIAYAGRVAGGILAHRSGRPGVYWLLVFTGYTVNLVAVPLLALAGRWWEAFALYTVERVGKGVRTAPRDAILASVAEDLGPERRGLIFSLHETADQVGALAGGLIVAAALVKAGSYRLAFTILAVPAAAALASLAAAYHWYPEPRVSRPPGGPGRPAVPGWAAGLSLAAGLGMASFMHWGLASYRLSTLGIPAGEVALLYTAAMAADAAAALPIGVLYDRSPAATLALGPLASAAATTLLALQASPLAASLAWGVAMAFYETAFRASAARAPPESRAAVYTMLYASMGAGWTLGNIALARLLANPHAAASLAWALAAAGALTALLKAGEKRL
ncbi:MFS transporter [Stetteria hydrogenophila]